MAASKTRIARLKDIRRALLIVAYDECLRCSKSSWQNAPSYDAGRPEPKELRLEGSYGTGGGFALTWYDMQTGMQYGSSYWTGREPHRMEMIFIEVQKWVKNSFAGTDLIRQRETLQGEPTMSEREWAEEVLKDFGVPETAGSYSATYEVVCRFTIQLDGRYKSQEEAEEALRQQARENAYWNADLEQLKTAEVRTVKIERK